MNALDRRIWQIAVPAFVALVTEPLMLLADTAIVGHLGTPELAGLAVAAVVLGTLVGLCVFLAYGTTAVVARSHGAGRTDAAFGAAVSGLWLAVAIGIAIAIVTAAAAGPLTVALASSPQVAGHARTYLLISLLGMPSMLLILAATGALRGLLDLRTPVIVAICVNVANVVLNVLLVYGLGWGIAGAAVGSVIAQTAGAIWLAVVVARRAHTSGVTLSPRAAEILDAARRGVPLLMRTLSLRIALLLAVVVAATFGDAPLAAHQIAMAVVTFLAFALDAIAIAGQTLTGRSLGAGDLELTRALTRRMMAWGAAFGAAAGVALVAVAPVLGPLFGGDPAVHTALVPALVVVALIQPISGVVFVLDGVLIGAGDGVYLAWSSLMTLLAYVPLAWTVERTGAGLTWLWVAYGAFMAARLVTLWLRQRGDRWMITGA